MKFYHQSIILFGIVLPALLAAGIIVACVMGQKKIATTLEEKGDTYRQLNQTRRAMVAIEAEVSAEREHLERWQSLLAEETASAVTRNLRAIADQLPEDTFQQTSFNREANSGGFGAVSAQKSSQIRIGVRGTYRSIQHAFLDLETRMPQLQLQDFRVSPNPNQPSMLNVQISYTAWEN